MRKERREGAVKSVKPRARKVASRPTLLMLTVKRGLVKKINAIIFGPPIGRGPPRIAGSAGSVVMPLIDNVFQ